MEIINIAEVAHEANRAYCRSFGDESQVPWNDAPEWQRKSAVEGVRAVVSDPNKTPEHSHEGWLDHKEADGWVFGEVKDAEKKVHPCMVPYADLPEWQKVKDSLFTVIVKTLLRQRVGSG